MSSLGIGVVGAASWGRNVVRAFAPPGAPTCAASAISAPSCSRAWQRSILGCASHLRTTICWAIPEIGAIALAVDSGSHHRLARRALESGRHVFVEKPLALTVPDSEELCDVAERNGRTLMVGHLLLYHPGVVVAKQSIDDGELGQVRYLHSERVNAGVCARTRMPGGRSRRTTSRSRCSCSARRR